MVSEKTVSKCKHRVLFYLSFIFINSEWKWWVSSSVQIVADIFANKGWVCPAWGRGWWWWRWGWYGGQRRNVNRRRGKFLLKKKKIIHRIPVYELCDCICQTFYLPDLDWQFEGGAGAAAWGNCVACWSCWASCQWAVSEVTFQSGEIFFVVWSPFLASEMFTQY